MYKWLKLWNYLLGVILMIEVLVVEGVGIVIFVFGGVNFII